MTLPTTGDVPDTLLEYDQWVCWREQTRGEKQTKVPVNPHTGRFASATDDETWGSFETAREYATDGAAEGLGFVFREGDPFVGVDLDDARDPDAGTPTDWAADIVDALDSYTEVSPSGTGYHVLVDADLPPGRNRRGDVECYDTARFFTVTAAHVETTPTEIRDRTDALRTVYADHVADDHESPATAERPESGDEDRGSDTIESSDDADGDGSPNESLSDEELLARARAASNSAKFEQLWRGDTHGYDSHSEADMALACLLAFWTGGDAQRVDRLFRRSGLMREKWDAVHYADGSTYGETTVERACSVTTEYYSPSDEQSDEPQPDADDETPDSGDDAVPESPARTDVQPSDDADPVHERERARIETITKLERRLRELEAENERLRDQRDAERAKRKQLESEAETDDTAAGILSRVKRLLA